jgi:Uncharacterized conserved protein
VNITIVSVGKIKEKYIKLGMEEFQKRLSKYCKLSLIEVADEKAPENMSEKEMENVKKSGRSKDTFKRQRRLICNYPGDRRKHAFL